MKNSLNPRQRVFVEEYLRCWVGTEAAVRAGYSKHTANEQAARLLAKVSVKKHIERRISELKATTDEVLLRLASHSRSSMDDFLVGDTLNLDRARELGKMHLIKRLKVRTTTVSKPGSEAVETHDVEVELYDAQAATVQLAKILGQYVERVEIYDWRKDAPAVGVDPDDLVAVMAAVQSPDSDKERALAQFIGLLERAAARGAGGVGE